MDGQPAPRLFARPSKPLSRISRRLRSLDEGPQAMHAVLNPDQVALVEWITAGLRISEVRDMRGDAGYLLNNMIAKFSLAASEYLLSKAALSRLKQEGVDLNLRHRRSRFYGKKSPFLYEHTIPASLVRHQLLSVQPVRAEVEAVLSSAGAVAVVLREEDDLLRLHGLRSFMPEGWAWGDDPLARYHVAGLEIAEQRLQMEGAICR